MHQRVCTSSMRLLTLSSSAGQEGDQQCGDHRGFHGRDNEESMANQRGARLNTEPGEMRPPEVPYTTSWRGNYNIFIRCQSYQTSDSYQTPEHHLTLHLALHLAMRARFLPGSGMHGKFTFLSARTYRYRTHSQPSGPPRIAIHCLSSRGALKGPKKCTCIHPYPCKNAHASITVHMQAAPFDKNPRAVKHNSTAGNPLSRTVFAHHQGPSN